MRALLIWAILWQAVADGQTTPTKEYVYLGGRLVAVESMGPAVTVTVDCNTAVALGSGESRTCTATVTGSTNTSVAWSVVSGGGSISAGGVYTAAAVTSTTAVQVKAVWAGDGATSGNANLAVNPVLMPASVSVGNSGQTGLTVQVTKTGAWTAVSNDSSMITIQSGASGAGPGTVTYSVSGNSGSGRTGTMTIAGNTFSVTQSAGGTATLTPLTASVGNAAGSGTVTVTVTGPWAATSDSAWATVSPATGSGNATVTYSYADNTGAARTATLTIGNTAFTLTQAASGTATLSPKSASVGSLSGTGTVSLTVAGPWTATSNATWVTPTPVSGSGNATVSYSYLTNTGAARSATLTIGNTAFAVTQAACALALNPVAATVAATSGSYSVTVTSGCASWSVTSGAAWLTPVTTSGSGNGTVTYSVQANTGAQRVANLSIGGVQFPVTQAAGATYDLTPASVTLYQGNTQAFTLRQVQGGVTTDITSSATWTLSPAMGTIVGGSYTAPTSFTPGQQVIVTATVPGVITKMATVTLQPLGAPSNMTIYPNTGSGASRQFNLYAYYSSTWDLSQNPARYVMFHNTNTTTANGCYVLWYMVGTNGALYLGNDTGTGWVSGPSTMPLNTTTPRSVGPENSQCSLDINASGQRNDAANYLRLMMMVYFKPVFAGGKSIFYHSGNEESWWTIGSWTVTAQ